MTFLIMQCQISNVYSMFLDIASVYRLMESLHLLYTPVGTIIVLCSLLWKLRVDRVALPSRHSLFPDEVPGSVFHICSFLFFFNIRTKPNLFFFPNSHIIILHTVSDVITALCVRGVHAQIQHRTSMYIAPPQSTGIS